MIHVRDLCFTYAGASAPAVQRLDFTVGSGEIFGFLGPSGAGKSTTQRILVGLLREYSGQVRVCGKEMSAWQPQDYERIGVCFEAPTHFLKLTGLENLRYFAALYSGTSRPPKALLNAVGLLPDADKPVAQYSKGMKVRLSVARSLLCDPELLFLDEPTNGLDPANARSITNLIREERAAGRTVFLTTHDMLLAEAVCDRVAFIVDGRIACMDTPRSLRLRHGERSVSVEYKLMDGIGRIDFSLEGLGVNAAFLELLREREIETLHTCEANLADVFIRVTGRGLA